MAAKVTVGQVVVTCIFLLVAGAVFWPGLYRYDEIRESITGVGFTVTLLRINRITGRVETLDRNSGKWLVPTKSARVTWNEAVSLLRRGCVVRVAQSHSLAVDLRLVNGTTVVTREPEIDAILHEIRRCGGPCAKVIFITE